MPIGALAAGAETAAAPAVDHRSGYIDQWRGISVLMVIADHLLKFRFNDLLSDRAGSDPASVLTHGAYLWRLGAGQFGVSIFFVISGYLITSLMLAEEARTGRISLGAFYVRRVCRILPALALYIAAVCALDAAGAIRLDDGEVLSAVSFLCNTSLVTCSYHFGQLWTLSIEEQFYLVWPLLLVITPARGRVPLVSIALAVLMAVSLPVPWRAHYWVNNGLAFGCIGSGALFALSPRVRGACARVVGRVPNALLFALLAGVLPLWWAEQPAWLLLTLPATVCAAVLGRHGDVLPSTWLSRALRGIGLISYSLYLWHVMFTWEASRYHAEWFRQASVLAFPAAWLSWRFVERPFIALGRRLAARAMASPSSRGRSTS